jgi:hypothetical protein
VATGVEGDEAEDTFRTKAGVRFDLGRARVVRVRHQKVTRSSQGGLSPVAIEREQHRMDMPVHRSGPSSGQETSLALIETSDQPRAIDDFNPR